MYFVLCYECLLVRLKIIFVFSCKSLLIFKPKASNYPVIESTYPCMSPLADCDKTVKPN